MALAKGNITEWKRLIKMFVETIKLAPENLAVEFFYRLPEPVMKGVLAGARYSPVRECIEGLFLREWMPPRKVDIHKTVPCHAINAVILGRGHGSGSSRSFRCSRFFLMTYPSLIKDIVDLFYQPGPGTPSNPGPGGVILYFSSKYIPLQTM